MTESAAWSAWTGVLAIENELAADGRSIEPGALTWPMMPAPLFRMVGNESEYVGTIQQIRRIDGRLEASGRIAGYAEGEVLAVHMHIDAQGVRPNDRGADPRRIHGGSIVGARLADSPNWPDAVITIGEGEARGAPAADVATQDRPATRADLRELELRLERIEQLLLRLLVSLQD